MKDASQLTETVDPELLEVVIFLLDEHLPIETKQDAIQEIHAKNCPLPRETRRIAMISVILILISLDVISIVSYNIPLIVLFTLFLGGAVAAYAIIYGSR